MDSIAYSHHHHHHHPTAEQFVQPKLDTGSPPSAIQWRWSGCARRNWKNFEMEMPWLLQMLLGLFWVSSGFKWFVYGSKLVEPPKMDVPIPNWYTLFWPTPISTLLQGRIQVSPPENQSKSSGTISPVRIIVTRRTRQQATHPVNFGCTSFVVDFQRLPKARCFNKNMFQWTSSPMIQ